MCTAVHTSAQLVWTCSSNYCPKEPTAVATVVLCFYAAASSVLSADRGEPRGLALLPMGVITPLGTDMHTYSHKRALVCIAVPVRTLH